MSRCRAPGCIAPVYCKELCSKHYKRFQTKGHIELNVPVTQAWLSEHVNYQGEECLIWPFAKLNNGYGVVRYKSAVHPASRVMCEMAHGLPPDRLSEAAHGCGNGHAGCVNPRHLDWKSKSGNEADKVLHGTSNRGERCAASKLTESQVHQIRALDGQFSRSQIGKMFGVSRQTAKDIILRRRWAWLEG